MQKTIEFLEKINNEGIKPSLWFRDDDIITDSPNFRMISKIAEWDFPIVFGVVPYRMKFSDADLNIISKLSPNIFFAVHGFNHANRSETQRPTEYPSSIQNKQVERELRYGLQKLNSYFPERSIAMFIPPWNNIDESHIATVKESGFKVISGSDDVIIERGASEIDLLPTNLDILNYGNDIWYPLKSEEALDEELFQILTKWYALKNFDTPIGLLSHHTSMLSKDISKYLTCIRNIISYFKPYNIKEHDL